LHNIVIKKLVGGHFDHKPTFFMLGIAFLTHHPSLRASTRNLHGVDYRAMPITISISKA